MDFRRLENELEEAIEADKKYQRENDAKFRAIEQKVATYDEFRDIVKGCHLQPLDKKDKIPDLSKQNTIWNTIAEVKSPCMVDSAFGMKKTHFTENIVGGVKEAQ